MDEPKWVAAMWEELLSQPRTDQIVVAGDWINLMTTRLLTELGSHRRITVAEIVALPGWDPTRLAETIGGRPTSVRRLGEDGRKLIRARDRRGQAEGGAP